MLHDCSESTRSSTQTYFDGQHVSFEDFRCVSYKAYDSCCWSIHDHVDGDEGTSGSFLKYFNWCLFPRLKALRIDCLACKSCREGKYDMHNTMCKLSVDS